MGKNLGLATLRQLQWRSAMNGNVRMQIWLGINWLGQSNRIDAHHSGDDGGPIKTITTEMTHAEAQAIWEQILRERPL